MSTLEINLLGELRIVLDGSPITTQIPLKSQAILAYLAATREVHSRHALAGLFWGDRPEEKAKNSLRVAINGLRKKIPDHLDISRQRLGLRLSEDVQLDLVQLESAFDGSETITDALEKIPHVYRGDFLTDLRLEEAPEFDEWIESQRATFRQMALRCLSKLTEQYLEDRAFDKARKVLACHLEIDPCAEEAHRRAMIAHSRKGDLEAALAQYQRCKQSLKDILGVEPAPETTAIFVNLQSLKSQPVQPPLVASRGQLIGRENELEKMRKLLGNPSARLITVAGFGGIGKTQLVLAILEEIVQKEGVQFLHGVSFVPLVGIDSASSIPLVVADTLGSPLTGKRNPVDALLDMLRGKEMLLILDNFEHLIDGGVEVINQILSECPKIKLVTTCREWLNIDSEWRLGLEGLSYSQEWSDIDKDTLLSSPAVEFFLEEVNRSRPGFQLEPEDYEPICRLCHLVGGIPLALMLAATWVRSMSIDTIANEVAADLDILTCRIHHMPPRQRSMKVIFDSAWNQLMPHEQEMFQALSVFRGGFTVDAASSLSDFAEQESQWALTLDTLDLLADRGLVQYDESTDRYLLHQLIRQYGGDKLKQDAQVEQLIQQRHSTYYCGQLAKLEHLRKGSQQLEALKVYRSDSENFVAAWQTAINNQQVNVVAESVDSLASFFEWRSGFSEAVLSLEAAAQMLHILSITQSTHLVLTTFIKTLSWLANFYRLIGETARALESLAQAERILESDLLRGYDPLEANDLLKEHDLDVVKAFYALQRGHLEINVNNALAQAHYNLSLRLYRKHGQDWESAVVLEALSMVSQAVGDLGAAQNYIEASLAIREQMGDRPGTAAALSILSSVIRFQGQRDNAIRFARESKEIYQSIGDRSSIAEGLHGLGMTLNYVGKFTEALEQIEESIALFRRLNNSTGLAKAHASASHVSGCLGQFDRASYHANQTVTIGEAINELRWVANGYTLMGWHAVVGERYEQALLYAEKSLALSKNAGGHAEEDIARSVMSYAYEGLGKIQKAQNLLLAILNISLRERDFLPLVTVIPKVVLMLLQQFPSVDDSSTGGEVTLWQQRAIVAYTVIRRWPVVSSSKLLESPITNHLKPLIAALPASLIAQAESIAATMDIWDVVSELSQSLLTIGWGKSGQRTAGSSYVE